MSKAEISLAQSIAAYLPESVVTELITVANENGQLEPCCFDAVTMMFDISGFTPMCEALALKGREGTEQVTILINAFFTQVLRPVQEQAGTVAKFGGDAFIAFFRRETHEDWDTVANRALYCAFKLQEIVLNYEHLRFDGELFRLSAKIGLSAGAILTFSVGQAAKYCDFQAVGEPFNEAADAEHHANKGDVIAHIQLIDWLTALQSRLNLGEKRADSYQLLAFQALPLPFVTSLPDFGNLSQTKLNHFLTYAAAYIPRSIYERLKLGYQTLPGEHRPVVSLFVNFTGFHWLVDEEAPARFREFYQAVLEQVEQYNGHLNRISSGDKGDLLHIIFGAPIAHQDDDTQAIRCALALVATARRFESVQTLKIGLSMGFVFAGDVGSSRRHEYTVIGDTVNLSARLMQIAADWAIVVDGATVARVEPHFKFSKPRAVQLKGKSGLIKIYEVRQIREKSARAKTTLPLHPLLPIYGRDNELAQMQLAIQTALNGQSQLLTIMGEAGIGKSVFVARLASDWGATGGRICGVSVLKHEQASFGLWAKWLRELIGSPEDFSDALGRLAPHLAEWTPLWAELLDLKIKEPAWFRSLDRATRRQRLTELMPELLRTLAVAKPLLLLCDDFHWVDSASLELLDQIVPKLGACQILVSLSFRPEPAQELKLLEIPQTINISLQALSAAASEQLILDSLATASLSADEQADLILQVNKMTGGNPFFIQELVRTLNTDNKVDTLSYNLQSLIMARLDALDSRLREIVLAASVAGGYFSPQMLDLLLPRGLEADLALHQLYQLDLFWSEPAGYCFRHALIQQVAYDSLPFGHRRILHEQIGQYYEAYQQNGVWLEQLTYHYERSNADVKAVLYLAKSAERSARLFANKEALRQYQTALQKAARAATPTTPPLTELLTGLADVHSQTATFDLALESYSQALLATSEHLERARLQQRQADVLVRATRFDLALETLQAAEHELGQLPKPTSQTKLIQAQLAELYSTIFLRQPKRDLAIEWAERGLKILAHSRSDAAIPTKIKLYQALAAGLSVTQQMQQAEQTVSKALHLAKKIENPVIAGQLQLRLAILSMQQNKLDKAPTLFQQALPLIEKTGARDRLAYVLLPGGDTFLRRGDFKQAQEWLDRGLALALEVGTPFLVSTGHYLLGRVHKELGTWQIALEHYEQSVALAQKYNLSDRLIEFLCFQAQLLAYKGDYEQANAKLQKALECAHTLGIGQATIYCYRMLAHVHSQHGFLTQAVTYWNDSKLLLEGELNVDEAYALVLFAQHIIDSHLQGRTYNDWDGLFSRIEKALHVFQMTHFKIFLPETYRILGVLKWLQTNDLEAIRYFKRGLILAKPHTQPLERARLLAWYARLNNKKASPKRLSEANLLFKDLGAYYQP